MPREGLSLFFATSSETSEVSRSPRFFKTKKLLGQAHTYTGTYPFRADPSPPPLPKSDLSACSLEFFNRPDIWPLAFLAAQRREDEVSEPLFLEHKKSPVLVIPPSYAPTHKLSLDRFYPCTPWFLWDSHGIITHNIWVIVCDIKGAL